MSLTPSREMFRDNRACTDGDLASVAGKGELKIEGYGQLSLKFRERILIMSLDKVSYAPKLRYNLISLGPLDDTGKRFTAGGGRITMCGTDLKLKKRFGTLVGTVDRVKSRENDFTTPTSCSDSHSRHQASAKVMALFPSEKGRCPQAFKN